MTDTELEVLRFVQENDVKFIRLANQLKIEGGKRSLLPDQGGVNSRPRHIAD